MTPVEHARGDTSIREAVRADLLDVLHIEKRVFPQPWPYSAFERHVDAPGFLVSETDANSDPETPAGESSGGESPGGADADVSDGEIPGDVELGGERGGTLGSLTAVGDSIRGYVVADELSNHGQPLGHVKNLAVHPDCQNEGVGSALLARSLSVLAGQGARGAKLEVRRGNDAAIALYRSFDFERLRTIPDYYADGEDALLFVVDLEDRDSF